MTAWYANSIFYHMYPLGMTGVPRENPFSWPCGGPGAPDETGFSHAPGNSSPMAELCRWIPHLMRMNFTAVYIGPLFESSSHGYDTRDYSLVDRRLGTNGEFKSFVALCHENHIRVVVDGVFNHTGREFFAFRDIREHGPSSRYAGWYRGVHFGCQSPLGDPFSYEAWRGIWELPCLNLQNPEVKEYLKETIRFWVSEFDIDGIRLDCANVLDFQFMRELRVLCSGPAAIKPDFWLMGEVIHGEYARWVNDETLHSVTNYEMHKSIYSAHNDHNYFELAHNVRRLEAVCRKLYTFLDNHDEDRIASKLNDKAHLKLIYTLLYTLPGIPSVYYGSEWGVEGKRSSTSDTALRPRILPEEAEQEESSGLSSHIRLLGRIHKEHPALHGGTYRELFLTNRQYAFLRQSEDGPAVLTAANNDSAEASLSLPCPVPCKTAEKAPFPPGKEPEQPDNQAPAEHGQEEHSPQKYSAAESGPFVTELLTGKKFPVRDGKLSFTLPPNSAFIFSFN